MKMKKQMMTGILALLLVFAFIGCDNGTTSGGEYITITGIPDFFNGMWAGFEGQSATHMILGMASYNRQAGTVAKVQISGGSVTLPTWRITAGYVAERFSGNTTTDGLLTISSVPTIIPYNNAFVVAEYAWSTVVFSGGNATLTVLGGEGGVAPAYCLIGTWVNGNWTIEITAGTGNYYNYTNTVSGVNWGRGVFITRTNDGISGIFMLVSTHGWHNGNWYSGGVQETATGNNTWVDADSFIVANVRTSGGTPQNEMNGTWTRQP